MRTTSPRTFYVIAVGGTAMAPFASLLVERGDRVLGSDLLPLYPPMSDRIAALGIDVRPGFDAANLPADVDQVVVGNLAGKDNPELVEALRRGLPVTSMPEALRTEFLAGRHPVVVAGTHGKTTTTALTAWLLAAGGLEPGFLVGGEPLDFDGPSAVGRGAPFVVEGDEYSTSWADKGPKFLHYAPRTLVVTSVELDHADLYPDLASVKEAFRKVVALVPPDGLIVANGDDPGVLDVLGPARARVLRYGIAGDTDVTGVAGTGDPGGGRELAAAAIDEGPDAVRFDVLGGGRPAYRVASPLAGRHNVGNALAALAVGEAFGLSPEALASALARFRGVRRRLEVKGTAAGVTVVDDFAHHPTAVETTLAGARRRWPGRRLWAAFEPRSLTAGRAEFADRYERALSVADGVALAVPHHAARLSRPGAPGALDAAAVAGRLAASGREAFAGANADELAAGLLARLAPGDVVVVMSSGAFGGLCGKLLAALADREGLVTPPARR